MGDRDLKARTRAFALRVIRMTEALPRNNVCDVIGNQLLRSGVSVGANYRAACRAKSNADFIAKLGIVEEELDESIYWMELLVEANFLKPGLVRPLSDEANELLAITVASIKTAKANR
jgi:four helix bundle protein